MRAPRRLRGPKAAAQALITGAAAAHALITGAAAAQALITGTAARNSSTVLYHRAI